MQEKLLQELLKISSDFILVLNASGSVLQVGAHLQAALLKQGLDCEGLAAMVKEHAALLTVQDTFFLPLDTKGVLSSPFSVVFRDHERIVLLAADRKAIQSLVREIRNSREREESFREKDERVHILLDESSDPIFSFAADGTYLYINRVFADTIGRKPQDVIGKKI